MCNHYRLDARDVQLHKAWTAHQLPPAIAALERDVWPQRRGLVFHQASGGGRFEAMDWGVPVTVPGKRPGTTVKRHVTNVRNLASPFWKSTLSRPGQRCLVPFSQFAEPRGCRDPVTGGPGEYWFSLKDDPVAAFAGIWREAEGRRVFAFLTCEPNALVAPLHPKAMPVILAPEDYPRWLAASYEEACTMATPFPSQLMDVT